MAGTDGWIQGDGGPLVLLQAAAVPHWSGATEWDSSLMNGGRVETDYDVICRCPDGATLIERHGREMLVLTDCKWAGRFITSPRGEVVIVQPFGVDEDLGSFIARITAAPPSETLRFTVVDRRLRLLPGADDGRGSVYGFLETEVTPGVKTCEIWYGPDAQIVVLRPVE